MFSYEEKKSISQSLNQPKEGFWSFSTNLYKVFENADAAVILTEWEEYKHINWEEVSKKMRKPGWIFDARSIINDSEVKKANLNFWRIGDGLNRSNKDNKDSKDD